MLTLQHITYAHPNKDVLFDNLDLSIDTSAKIAMVGNNGTGKSTLLQIMAGRLQPLAGTVKSTCPPYYIPQHFGQYDHYTVAAALGIEEKLNALRAILDGETSEARFTALADDWTIEEKCSEALLHWRLGHISPWQELGTLSGGQKTKVFLAGILIHQPGIVLMDEPSNHLDSDSRRALYEYIHTTSQTLVAVSHDRTLLNMLPQVYELDRNGITVYGGNYDFYAMQKAIAGNALQEALREKEKALRKARDIERAAMERQQKQDARGRKKQDKAGVPTIALNTLRNHAERSTAKTKAVHAEKTGGITKELQELRKELPGKDRMKIGFDDTNLHTGKILVTAKEINYGYDGHPLWEAPLNFVISSGDRIAISGPNGSGKTTLIRIITGQLLPHAGTLDSTIFNTLYIDQDYSLVNNQVTVYEQAQLYNTSHLQEHAIKRRLTHFLFAAADWDKPCAVLSGGEKMRLILCCLSLGATAPDMIILDEPTNNLDLQNTDILTQALKDYKGTLLVVSHDARFLEEVDINTVITVV